MPTHLGVPLKQIINLETGGLENNNNSEPFYFDGDRESPFAMPRGWSFVITDILVLPAVTEFHPAQFFFVVVIIDGARVFAIKCDGRSKHISLASGLVVPGNHRRVPGYRRLAACNTSFSTGSVSMQAMGYLIKEKGLGIGDVFTS